MNPRRVKRLTVFGVTAALCVGCAASQPVPPDASAQEAALRAELARREAERGPDALEVAESLTRLGEHLQEGGDYRTPVALYERSLAIREAALGPDALEVAESLDRIARLRRENGDYATPEALYQRALAIRRSQLGERDPAVAEIWKHLGELPHDRGDYPRAEELYLRAIEIQEEQELDPDPELAETKLWLGMLYAEQGLLTRAEMLYLEAFADQAERGGVTHPAALDTAERLGTLYAEKGDLQLARSYFLFALDGEKRARGPDHPRVADASAGLGDVYFRLGFAEQAEPLLREALAIREATYGPDHIMLAYALDSLVEIERGRGDLASAEAVSRRALAIRVATLGEEHQEVASSSRALASVLTEQGRYAEAEAALERALAIDEELAGPDSSPVAWDLVATCELHWTRGDPAGCVPLMARAEANLERATQATLRTGSERQKSAYIESLVPTTYQTVSLHLGGIPDDPAAARLAYETILRRKGRVIDAMAGNVRLPFRMQDGALRPFAEQWIARREEIAALSVAGPGEEGREAHTSRLNQLQLEADVIETVLSQQQEGALAESRSIEIEEVQARVPPDATLVELFLYRSFDPRRDDAWGEVRYSAYLLAAEAGLTWVDLGPADPIDAAIERLRAMLADPRAPVARIQRHARALDAQLFAPIAPGLGDRPHVLLAADGTAGLLPFSALVDPSGAYRVETLLFSYLTSGRDLLRGPAPETAPQPALVVANPCYGGASGEEVASASRWARLGEHRFAPLPGTLEEADALAGIVDDARVLTGAEATESQVKAARAPRFLHIATHGYFLPDAPRDALMLGETPLLRAGLAFAGANTGATAGADDGILTALEAASLDLVGTELVVLSACETGVGKVRAGEGVYGLRRALVLAGARTQVLSLWAVSDAVTRDLMVAYYERLLRGEPRAEALRQVQLEQLAALEHPVYWAPFIVAGDWGPLEGENRRH